MDFISTAQVLGNLGEFFGAIAVVATLVYLANQLRDQNRANEIAAFEGMMDGFNQLLALVAADKDTYRIFIRGLNRPEELDDDEAGSFSFLLRMYLNTYHKMYRAYRRGAIDKQAWSDYASEAAELLDSPGGRAFLESQSAESWEYIQSIRDQLRPHSVVDVSLGRDPLRRASSA